MYSCVPSESTDIPPPGISTIDSTPLIPMCALPMLPSPLLPASLAPETSQPDTPSIRSCTPPVNSSSSPDNSSYRVRLTSDMRRKNRTALQRLIEKVAQDVKHEIDRLESNHPTHRLWHHAPRPRKALKDAMEQLAQYPPCSVSTLATDIQDEQFYIDLVSLMHNVLRNLLLPKLRSQIRRSQSTAKRMSGAPVINNIMRTIPEEKA
ncbi:hypothetical protein SISNIDRAFT_491851 [Sistotremastrum niveocremeum HHB9708]|uniref:Uncharacterized protein n=1 Tax=Sistotremastrum niveocremeum HHB9708 TaxID=1314777 RepID=A0A164MBP0_9AGAM|nr:hypothetical protein SISNIDRAFT_491851 [Sistotremastrum niveocremeum HHB9708]